MDKKDSSTEACVRHLLTWSASSSAHDCGRRTSATSREFESDISSEGFETVASVRVSCLRVQKIINGKYKIRIIWDLQHGPRRYGEIQHGLLTGAEGTKQVAPRVLSRELKELRALGLIDRRDYGEAPLKVEYKLTAKGESLIPVISVLHAWGVQHLVKDSILNKLGIKRE